jgi:hypothetical protein
VTRHWLQVVESDQKGAPFLVGRLYWRDAMKKVAALVGVRNGLPLVGLAEPSCAQLCAQAPRLAAALSA